MVMLANGEVEQLPGPDAGLGLIMFDMPNRFDVYLHDTPDRDIFSRENRRISHGCIRVQNPRDFAALLMEQPIDAIDRGDRGGQHHAATTCRRRCRCSWSTRPRSSMPAGRCSSAPTSTIATPRSGESLQERPQGLALAAQADSRPTSPKPL